jgi:hypothetical protein
MYEVAHREEGGGDNARGTERDHDSDLEISESEPDSVAGTSSLSVGAELASERVAAEREGEQWILRFRALL